MKTLRLKQLALLIAPLLSSSPLLAANVVEDNTKELAEMTVRHSRPATVVQNPSPQAEVTGEQARKRERRQYRGHRQIPAQPADPQALHR
jgi:hypothetical protein